MTLATALLVAAERRDRLGITVYVLRGWRRYITSTHPPRRERDIIAIYPAHGYWRPHRDYR